MIFEGVTSWIHALTKPKEKPPEPPEQKFDPHYRRYAHLKTEAGEWKKPEVHEPGPRLSPEDKARERLEASLYKEAVEQVSFVEDMSGRNVSGYNSGSAWDHAWDEVNKLPLPQAHDLKDRLLVCHSNWQRMEDALEKIRSLRAELERSNRLQALEHEIQSMDAWLTHQEQNIPGSPLSKTHKKMDWFHHRLAEEKRIATQIDQNIQVKPYAEHGYPATEGRYRRTILHSMQTPILETVAETKSTRLKREMARTDQKAVKSELQTITFQIERELGATRPRQEVNRIMEEIQEGTFKVGAMSRVRDWFSSALGRMAGHAETPNLHYLVEQHRFLSQKLAKIEQVLQRN